MICIFCFAISVVILILIYNKELGIANNSFEAGYAFAEEQYSIYGKFPLDGLMHYIIHFEYNDFHLGVIHFGRIKTND